MISFQLTAIFTRLQNAGTRHDAANELATHTRSDQVLLFFKDDPSSLYCPAPGMAPLRAHATPRQRFLRQCAGAGRAEARLDADDGATGIPAYGIGCGTAVLVFLGERPGSIEADAIGALLPLLATSMRQEHGACAPAVDGRVACDGCGLPGALELSRGELCSAREHGAHEQRLRCAAETALRDADRRTDEFLAMLAHELRNPLAPISMAAQILTLGAVNEQRRQQAGQIIERQIGHLSGLLDDLLDVARVAGGQVVLAHELLDLRALARDAVEQARPLLMARRHRLELALPAPPALVRGDATRLVQVIANLLDNASRYTPPGGNITLRMAIAPEHVELIVSDDGIGIAAKLLPRVFGLFTQGERGIDRAQGGLGLGLALVKGLVERHGGSVVAHSPGVGQGSRFSIRLPRALGETLAPPALAMARAPASALSIMIVDDNADAAQTLAVFLESRGHMVQVAFDGHSALDMASSLAPQVLLLDIGLPDVDGYQLARTLRALTPTARATFIALTGYGQPQDKERARAAGFDHHLTKPVAPAALLGLLDALSPAAPD
jgi:signal transduction histidine kinase/CheY-like chemotaxis protein